MKARKINLKEYMIEIFDPNADEGGKIVKRPYNVKLSIENIMLASGRGGQGQNLSMPELLRNARIAQKITASKDGFVLLEEEEFRHVQASFSAFRGFDRNAVELCKRIDEAETVDVEEKKAESKKPKAPKGD
jgi:hypothetical protein